MSANTKEYTMSTRLQQTSLAMILLLLPAHATGYSFEASRLVVTVGGSVVLDDEFSDGASPPSSPGGAPYATQGTWGPEAGGVVTAAEADALIQPTGLIHTAVQQSFVSFSDDVSIATTWNLIAHDVGQPGGYGSIFISNVAGSISAHLLLGFLDPTTGLLRLDFQRFDETTMATTSIGSMTLDPASADQVVLTLSQTGGSLLVEASYDLLQTGSSIGNTTFSEMSPLAPSAMGVAFGLQAAATIPEPTELALLLVGMVGAAHWRAKQQITQA
jgi:hypothetical protein